MKKKELFAFLIIFFILYLLFRIISSDAYYTPSTLNIDDLRNNRQVSSQKLYDDSWKMIKKHYIDSTYNSQDWDRWKKHYKDKIKTDDDAKVAIDTMIASLGDPYSRFLSKKEYEEQNNSIDSHITGIGVNIMTNSGKTIVYSVIEGTPADNAGIKANDIIIKVDNKDVNGMNISDVASLVRGPIDSKVTLTLKRGNSYIKKTIIRKKIEIKSVEASVRKDNIGYIKIKSFIGTNTASDFVKALKQTNDTKGLIIDLRGNTGGLLTNAVIIANMFINNGKIVSIVSKNGSRHDIKAESSVPVISKPTVVLVDEISASASEILSGALKDNKKAVLIGKKTYGKGLVQQIVPLPNGTGLNITIAKYLTPNGSDINEKGIEPDIVVNYTLADYKRHNDTQLKRAEVVINSMCK